MDAWTEVKIAVDANDVDVAADIAMMVVPYGIYIEDYRDLEQQAWEIARIDLIDEALLQKDRSKAFVHVYISPEESPFEAVAYLRERLTAAGIRHEIDQSACIKEEWENNWKQYFHTMEIGDRLVIKPKWEAYDNKDNKTVLSIEPGLAFGSGTHETTRLCLETLEPYIHSCGFFRAKGQNILAMSRILCEKYGGEVPRTMEELTALPGVGRKTANVVLSNAFGIPAIAVDTHVFRVTNRIGLAEAKDVEHTERQLMENIPREDWSAAHHWLIYHGRQVCAAQRPKCGACTLKEVCDFAIHRQD